MPKSNNSNLDILNNDANLSIYADHLGLTPQFVQDNKNRLERIERMVSKSLKNTDEDDPNYVFNTMKQLQNLTKETFIADSYDTSLNRNFGGMYGDPTTRDGFRMVYSDNDNKEDLETYNFHASIFSSYRNLVSEYRNVARLIPTVYRCADMKARDILAINEITKRSVSNVYIPSTLNPDDNDPSVLAENPINERIEKEILDRYDIEDRLPRYLRTALIEGAKPVVVFPYTDIVEMAKISMRNFSQKYADYKFRTSANSTEAYEDVISDYHSREHRLIPNFNDPKYKIMSTESVDGEEKISFNVKNYTDLRDSVIDKFVSKEDLNEYMTRGIEDVSNNIERVRNERLFDIYGSNVINKAEKVNEVNEKFREFQDKVKVDGSLSEHFKEQIFNAVKTIDSNIEFYDQSELAMGVSINNFRRLMQMSAYHENPKAGLKAFNVRLQDEKRLKERDKNYDQDPIVKDGMGFDNGPKSVLDEFTSDFSPNEYSLLNDCLIKEYDAEDVIPVIVAGRHVGYYIIETSPYTGNVESVNKRNCNFTDMFLNLGINNDFAISPSPATSGSFGAGVQGVPMGGIAAVSDLPSVGITGAGSMALGAGLDIAGFDVGVAGDDAIRRNNIMKKIMFNVLKQKINRHDIEDDETFMDTIMALIRDGAIVQNRIKIMYIPEKYMCYFTPGLDGNGIPESFMKNCLFTCYEKILVNMNNIMTRLTRTGQRDKITVNVGKAKNFGYSIRAIENALTTRKLNVESPFTSLSRVLKSASLSETIVVPIYDGEQLFEYEDISQHNTVDQQDDLEQRLENDIVTQLKCPVTITNPYQEEDFASLAASRNAEYRFDLIKLQGVFGNIATKFIKLLIVGSGLYKKIKDGNKDFTLSEILVRFAPPESLNMQNANNLFSTVQSYIENIIGIVINPDDDTEVTNATRFKFKQKLYQQLMPGIGLDKYIRLAQNLRPEANKTAIENRINRSVNDQIVNTEFKPIIVTPDGKVTTNDGLNQGIGNDEVGGF